MALTEPRPKGAVATRWQASRRTIPVGSRDANGASQTRGRGDPETGREEDTEVEVTEEN
jgi:hypothetical protein